MKPILKNKLDQLFENKHRPILSVYYTAGFPGKNDTGLIACELQDHGVNLLEIGIPFSDPMADGPVIQASSDQALKNGMHIGLLFEQLNTFMPRIHIPVILMGYFNPVLRFGIERFLQQCAAAGVCGCIIPDLPPDEYESLYKDLFARYGIHMIFMITPQTPVERIRKLDELSGGFVYLVSSTSTTGSQQHRRPEQAALLKQVRGHLRHNPCLIGFGISNAADFSAAGKIADGAIIGSAFIRAIGQGTDLRAEIQTFTSSILNTTSYDHTA